MLSVYQAAGLSQSDARLIRSFVASLLSSGLGRLANTQRPAYDPHTIIDVYRRSDPMRFLTCLLALVAISIGACAEAADNPEDNVAIEVAFENLRFQRPLYITHAPGSDRLFVVEQRGRIFSFPSETGVTPEQRRTVLDISEKVRSPHDDKGKNEEGLLGLAFHPDFQQNHKVYLDYSAYDGRRRNIISEWRFNPETGKIDPASERVIMEIDQPFWNHNGGHLAFGPEGYLYITKGDGGAGGDPRDHAQNLATRLGTIMRIDVDNRDNGKPYAIPETNPFVDRENARPEIYAYGLRNVWRFAFDPKTGKLWAGDVGQNAYEEIDIIEKGGNYGWNHREGFHAFRGRSKTPDMIDPVHDYPRSKGVSVTGGYVYRGNAIPALQGAYIFADFGTGYIWALRYDDEQGKVTEHRRIGQVPGVSSFGLGQDGEIYICSFAGQIHKLVPDK